MSLIHFTKGKSSVVVGNEARRIEIQKLENNNLSSIIVKLLETCVPSEFKNIIENELFFEKIYHTDAAIMEYMTKLNDIDDVHKKFEIRYKKYATEFGFELTMNRVLRG